ncbi:hypothetical protein D6D04_06993 [Aureobasidium pullulans]|nr:hypothetical protein D6D04_06993 [Aureobasidium pullulans]
MATPITARSILPTLPPELLGRVFDFVDDKDLISLRLVCRDICAAANRPFAICFFANSQHVATKHSIQALVNITAHGVFSPYIKTVTICSARIATHVLDERDNTEDTDEEDIEPHEEPGEEADGEADDNDDESDDVGETLVDTSFVRSGQFVRLLKIAFSNIRETSRYVAIGVSNDYRSRRSFLNISLSPKRRPYGWRTMIDASNIIFRTGDTLNIILAAASDSGCQINGLSVVYYMPCLDDDGYEMKKALERFFQTCTSPLDIYFDWKGFSVIEYVCREESVNLFGHFVSSRGNNDAQSPVDAVVRWILKQPMRDFYADSFKFSDLSFSDIYFVDSLEDVMLTRLELQSSPFGKDSYSNLFERLAAMPNLRLCEFYKFKYQIPRQYDGYSVELRSGTYPAKRDNLYLLFPNNQICLNVSGENVSQQLLDLAAYTSAAERKKIQAIEADGEVKDPWVSALDISHEPRKFADDDLGLYSGSDDDGLCDRSDEEEYEEEEEAPEGSEDSEDSQSSEDEDDLSGFDVA